MPTGGVMTVLAMPIRPRNSACFSLGAGAIGRVLSEFRASSHTTAFATRLPPALRGQDEAHHRGQVLGIELLHDMGPVQFDRAVGNSQLLRHGLVGQSLYEHLENFA